MIGAALAYPFLFVRRKPVTALACALVTLALSALLELSGTALSEATRGVDQGYYVAYALHYLIQSAVQGFPSGLLLVAALIDLELRDPARRPGLKDGALVAAVSLAFALLVTLPIFGLQTAASRAMANYVTQRTGPMFENYDQVAWVQQLSTSLWFVAALLFCILFFRLSFAWPHTLSTGKFVLLRAWSLSRGKFWRITSVLLPATLVAGLAAWAGEWVSIYINLGSPAFAPVGATMQSAPPFDYLAARTIASWIGMLGAFYFNLSNVCLYARLLPPKPETVAAQFG